MPPDSPFFVYLLRCRDGSYYAGYTDDLARRLELHNQGKASKYTASRRPVRLAWSEGHPDKSSAMRREAELKKLSHQRKAEMARKG